jgi:hypothetical protein
MMKTEPGGSDGREPDIFKCDLFNSRPLFIRTCRGKHAVNLEQNKFCANKNWDAQIKL